MLGLELSAVSLRLLRYCRGSYWTGLRGALQPLFHSHGLQSYQPLVEAAVEELAADLAPAAAAGGSVDMHAAMCNVALKAIGEAAFGYVEWGHRLAQQQQQQHCWSGSGAGGASYDQQHAAEPLLRVFCSAASCWQLCRW